MENDLHLFAGTELGLTVPPRPSQCPDREQAWTLYDGSEAEEFKTKGDKWLRATEQAVCAEHGLDLEGCEATLIQLRTAIADMRMQHQLSVQQLADMRVMRKRVQMHLDKLIDLDKCVDHDDQDHIQFCQSHMTSVMSNIETRSHNCTKTIEKIKEHMYVLQARVANLAPLTHTPACSICLSDPLTAVCVPCGHSYCAACAEKASHGSRCFICRAMVSHVNPLHIS